jgi:hypothetical protein
MLDVSRQIQAPQRTGTADNHAYSLCIQTPTDRLWHRPLIDQDDTVGLVPGELGTEGSTHKTSRTVDEHSGHTRIPPPTWPQRKRDPDKTWPTPEQACAAVRDKCWP